MTLWEILPDAHNIVSFYVKKNRIKQFLVTFTRLIILYTDVRARSLYATFYLNETETPTQIDFCLNMNYYIIFVLLFVTLFVGIRLLLSLILEHHSRLLTNTICAVYTDSGVASIFQTLSKIFKQWPTHYPLLHNIIWFKAVWKFRIFVIEPCQ